MQKALVLAWRGKARRGEERTDPKWK